MDEETIWTLGKEAETRGTRQKCSGNHSRGGVEQATWRRGQGAT